MSLTFFRVIFFNLGFDSNAWFILLFQGATFNFG